MIANISEHKPFFTPDHDEPLGRGSRKHPIEKLKRLGAFVTEEQHLESLYYVRYITDEQVYSPKGFPVRVNDLVGYPIYISSLPTIEERKALRSSALLLQQPDGWFHGGPGDSDS
jgi:hypothetical protein